MKSVLVVDEDNPEVADVVREFLKTDYPVIVYKDCKTAWEAISKDIVYDIVIAGGKKGADLLARINIRNLDDVRLILMSGSSDLEVQAEKLGARFLEKPFEKERLLEVLK